MEYIHGLYGMFDGGSLLTYPEERRQWRRHIEAHINKKTREAITAINNHTDDRVSDAEDNINLNIARAKEAINENINSAKEEINRNINGVNIKIGTYNDSLNAETLFGAIKKYRYNI